MIRKSNRGFKAYGKNFFQGNKCNEEKSNAKISYYSIMSRHNLQKSIVTTNVPKYDEYCGILYFGIYIFLTHLKTIPFPQVRVNCKYIQVR